MQMEENQKYRIIENTRMLFNFIEELDRLYSIEQPKELGNNHKKIFNGYNGVGGLKKRTEELNNEHNFVVKMLQEATDEKKFLWQNTLSRYLRFWNVFFKDCNESNYDCQWWENAQKDKDIMYIARMLHLFRVVRYLSEISKSNLDKERSNLPYYYEDICLTIRDLFEAKACALTYIDEKGDLKTIALSGYTFCPENSIKNRLTYEPYFDFSTDNSELMSNIVLGANAESFKQNSDNVFDCYCIRNFENKMCRQFSFPRFLINNKSNEYFYLFIISDKSTTAPTIDKNELKRITRLLFLRDSLMEIFSRDFSTLLHSRNDYSCVQPIKESDYVSIIHMSDLHLKDDFSWAQDGKLCNNTYLKFRQYNFECDLLVISGDIVNYYETAYEAQQKYKKAQEYLTKLAIALWGQREQTSGYVTMSHDWKKRIIITTGNHDYVAVNELKSISGDRKTQSALPIGTTNDDPLVKFTYFLQFLQEFLDLPIKELAQNDLNEMRIYNNLQICALSLNSNSLANSLQNNKVGLNENKIQLLCNNVWRENADYHKLVIVHHGPFYKIDYLNDIYESWRFNYKELSNEIVSQIKQIYDSYKEVVLKIPDKLFNATELHQLPAYIDLLDKYKNFENILRNKLKVAKSKSKLFEFVASKFYKDLVNICSIKYEASGRNEFDYKCLSDLGIVAIAQKEDEKAFKKSIHEILCASVDDSILNDKGTIYGNKDNQTKLRVNTNFELSSNKNKCVFLSGHSHCNKYFGKDNDYISEIMVEKGDKSFNFITFEDNISVENIAIKDKI